MVEIVEAVGDDLVEREAGGARVRLDDRRVVVPRQAVPAESVVLLDVVLLDVRRSLRDTDDAEAVLSTWLLFFRSSLVCRGLVAN